MGAQPGGAAARLPAHRERRRARAAGRHGRRPAVGELAVAGLLRVGLDHRALDPPRRPRHLARAARVGQPGADDVLLPRRRARGQARARRRPAARPPARRDPARRGARRHGARRARLPRLQRRRRRSRRLGRRDVDRHCVRARPAGAGGARRHAPADHAAHGRGVRRPGRAAGDRDRLHRERRARAADRRRRAVPGAAPAAVCAGGLARPARGGARRRSLGGAARRGDRSRDHGARGRDDHRRLPARAGGPRAGHRAHPSVPRAAVATARPLGSARRRRRDLSQRAAAVPAAPVDELRDRAAVRAGQHRDPRRRRPGARRSRLTDHARHLLRLRRRQAARHPARQPPRGAAVAGPDPDGAHLAGARGRSGRMRHRLHGLAAGRQPRVRGRAARAGEGRRAGGRRRRRAGRVAGLQT